MVDNNIHEEATLFTKNSVWSCNPGCRAMNVKITKKLPTQSEWS